MKNSPAIILVDSQMGENIGASARAMLNFGLTDLRIVNPRDGWPNQAAIDMSSGAFDIIEAKVFSTLSDAAKDIHYLFATTARPREMVKPIFKPASAAKESLQRISGGQKTAFVFGPERAGLSNDDVSLCHAILTMDTNPNFSSINLAAAVLLISYEWLALQGDKDKVETPTGASFPVEHEKLEEFLQRFEGELDKAGFFRAPDQKPSMMRNMRGLFTRIGMTDQEVRTFQGMLTALIRK